MLANLRCFEAPGGVLTSTQVTGNQWDAPFGWAPLQIIAVDGLRRYGHHETADRLARKFLGTGGQGVRGARRRSWRSTTWCGASRTSSAGIRFGYSANQVGFGWTNAAVLELLAGLDADGAGVAARPRSPERAATAMAD